jgi:hypothetical protein
LADLIVFHLFQGGVEKSGNRFLAYRYATSPTDEAVSDTRAAPRIIHRVSILVVSNSTKHTTAIAQVTGPVSVKATWVEPNFYADVEYRDITAEGLLRASSFKGLKSG